MTSFPFRGIKTLRIYSWFSLPDIKHDQKYFVILFYTWKKWKTQPYVTIIRNRWNYSGMKGEIYYIIWNFDGLVTFWLNFQIEFWTTHYKNFDFSFSYVFPSSMAAKFHFLTAEWHANKTTHLWGWSYIYLQDFCSVRVQDQKPDLLPEAHDFWPLAWSQTSTFISSEEKNAFLFFHSFHSFSQRKATITIKWQEKKLSMIKVFKLLFLTSLRLHFPILVIKYM